MNSELDNVIAKRIDQIAKNNNIYHLGRVIKVNDFIIEATGLDDVFFFEKVFVGSEKNVGYIDRITKNKVYIALVKTEGDIRVDDKVITTGEALTTAFSRDSFGMIIDPFGADKITGKKFAKSKQILVETPKISIMDRTDVCRPMETGIAAIDLMYPIGRGQRQLVIGDKKIGKTQIILDAIVNQHDKDMICIYVAIGKTKKDLKRLYAKLMEMGAGSYTIIVAAFNDDPAPLIKMTPYAAMSMAEEFLWEGKDVLVCIDDLKKHADVCREIALLSDKNTGRDAYPADIFYSHSRLLEKGCQHKNGGSITVLPIVETKGGDITDYISTNIISITDGQIVLSPKNFEKGQKPAINYGLSVSRLGGAVQKESIKKLGATVRQELLSYLETADIYQLVNLDSMPDEIREKMTTGKKLLDALRQPKFSPLDEKDLIEEFGFIMNKKDATKQEDAKKEKEEKRSEDNNDNVDGDNGDIEKEIEEEIKKEGDDKNEESEQAQQPENEAENFDFDYAGMEDDMSQLNPTKKDEPDLAGPESATVESAEKSSSVTDSEQQVSAPLAEATETDEISLKDLSDRNFSKEEEEAEH